MTKVATQIPKTHSHYERAFEQYVRARRKPCIPVQQLRRPRDADGPIKSFDFLVHTGSQHYIVDVKGRRFPQVSRGRETYWENWIHLADIEGMLAWEKHFGDNYIALLVYCYWLQLPGAMSTARQTVTSGGRDYLLVGIPVRTFAEHCRRRSLRWKALSIPSKKFTSLIRPIDFYIPDDVN